MLKILIVLSAITAPNFRVQPPNPSVERQVENYYQSHHQSFFGVPAPRLDSPVIVTIRHPGSRNEDGAGVTVFDEMGIRMQVTASPERLPDTLSHETMHVVLHTRYHDLTSRWLDEGTACLVEGDDEYHGVLRQSRLYDTGSLIQSTEYPEDYDRKIVYYAQSSSQCLFLLEHAPHRYYGWFLDQCAEEGIVRALKTCYNLTPQDLHRQWLSWLKAGCPKNQYRDDRIQESKKTRTDGLVVESLPRFVVGKPFRCLASPWSGTGWTWGDSSGCGPQPSAQQPAIQQPAIQQPAPQANPCQAWIDANKSWVEWGKKQQALVAQLQAEIKTLQAQIKDLESKLQEASNQDTTIQDLGSKNQELSDQIETLTKQLTELQAANKELETQITSLQSQITTLEAANKDLGAKNQDLGTQLTDLGNANNALSDQLKQGKPYYIFLCSDDSDKACYDRATWLKTTSGYDIRFVKLHGTNVSRSNLPRLYLFPSGKAYAGPKDVLLALETLDKIDNRAPESGPKAKTQEAQ